MKRKAVLRTEGKNHTAIEVGGFDNLQDYSYLHPKLRREITGKLFVGDQLKSTSTEISFHTLPPYTKVPFLHSHHEQEEIYIFLNGNGQFQVDDDLFKINEGSVIRVAPEGKRTWSNLSDSTMTLIVIQATINTIKSHFVADGYPTKGEIMI